MTTIRVPIGPAVDAVQRIALVALGANVEANYPAWQVQTADVWAGVELATATHAVWDDHRFTLADVALANVITADPARIPQDTAGLDRAAIEALYPTELAAEIARLGTL